MSTFNWGKKKYARRTPPEPSPLQAAVKRTTRMTPSHPTTSKLAMRDEADRLVKEALERYVLVKQAKTGIDAHLGRAGRGLGGA